MKNLNKNQWIAVSLSLVFLTYLLFADTIMNLFNPSPADNFDIAQMPQTGVVTEEIAIGNGPLVELGDTLTVHYVGTLSDGKVFDSSLDRNIPFSFVLGTGQVIRGWDEGLLGMRVGGKRLLIIAPDYGYGELGVGTIPPNSTLIFEVILLNVEKSASR
ncbi:MAG: FKBP-type peptidyl-prolyl cis-trans isomerase [Parcubacteria group bacterium GW2011_GWA1_49_11]|nr:MAG: FKBP-type peptidyl-prolyl cis-trans isomerase [Parcubacteria group bacterium GW2011_GWA1_49_11]